MEETYSIKVYCRRGCRVKYAAKTSYGGKSATEDAVRVIYYFKFEQRHKDMPLRVHSEQNRKKKRPACRVYKRRCMWSYIMQQRRGCSVIKLILVRRALVRSTLRKVYAE